MEPLRRYFGIGENGVTIRREIVGGITTFATMSYIVFVQPTVLATTGMSFGSVLLATCISSALACFLMGMLARYPIALAPGMGENFLFAFAIVAGPPLGMGFSWQAALTIVLISGLIFVALSVFKTREKIIEILPPCLTNSIGPAIGLFIGLVGLQWGGIIVSSPATMVRIGSFHSGIALMTLLGLFLIAALHVRKVPGGILIGILATAGLGIYTGVIPSNAETPQLEFSTFFQFNLGELVARWPDALVAILLFLFLDIFDTVGTLVAVGNQAGFLKPDGTLPRASRAFFSDAIGTCIGACCGTSTVTSYIESATGVAAGARTGLAAIVTGVCFLFAIFLAPVIHIAGQDVGLAFYNLPAGALHVAMYPVVAPALIFVGFLMMAPLRKINWEDVTESLPAFFTIAMMVFGYGITEGISAGIISYAVIKPIAGKWRQVHPILYIIALAFVARYAFLV
jgi:AGZA family xanthine/uracil permease-like MFS transporter